MFTSPNALESQTCLAPSNTQNSPRFKQNAGFLNLCVLAPDNEHGLCLRAKKNMKREIEEMIAFYTLLKVSRIQGQKTKGAVCGLELEISENFCCLSMSASAPLDPLPFPTTDVDQAEGSLPDRICQVLIIPGCMFASMLVSSIPFPLAVASQQWLQDKGHLKSGLT